jgi:hypothetical protein
MGKKSREKGRKGELELAKLIDKHLGLDVSRNLRQYQIGGHDLIGWDGVHTEVKRYASVTQGDIDTFWQQTISQCEHGDVPLLAYRANYQDWRFVLRPCDWGGPVGEPMQVDIHGLVAWRDVWKMINADLGDEPARVSNQEEEEA